jgi:hypothetical protein
MEESEIKPTVQQTMIRAALITAASRGPLCASRPTRRGVNIAKELLKRQAPT